MDGHRDRYEKFIAVTLLPDAFRFQSCYPTARRTNPERARTIASLGGIAGIPVNEKYWTF
jgi:hypothetical protein